MANTFGQGANGAGSNYGAAGSTWNSAVRNAGSPIADYVGGLATGGLKAWTANGGYAAGNPRNTFRADDPYRSTGYFGGDEGE